MKPPLDYLHNVGRFHDNRDRAGDRRCGLSEKR